MILLNKLKFCNLVKILFMYGIGKMCSENIYLNFQRFQFALIKWAIVNSYEIMNELSESVQNALVL
jgi:hypothetical protein